MPERDGEGNRGGCGERGALLGAGERIVERGVLGRSGGRRVARPCGPALWRSSEGMGRLGVAGTA